MTRLFRKLTKSGAAISVLCISIFASAADDASGPVDSFKPVLDHLQSLTVVKVPQWRFHDDLSHPEDYSLNDSGWDSSASINSG